MSNRGSFRSAAAAFGLAGAFIAAVLVGKALRLTRAAPASEQMPLLAPARQTAPPPIGRGEMVFQVYCAKCHGADGKGDAEALAVQKPPPRDFARRPWRFEVSPDSIRRVTLEGIAGTAMPAHHAALGPDDVEAVVAHVYHLAKCGSTSVTERSPLEQALLDAGFAPEAVPRLAPGLPLVDAEGNTSSLADERGRVVLLQFWGTSCEHCLQGMPDLRAFTDRWQSRGVTVLSVCADADSAGEAQEIVDRVSPATRVWTDSSGLGNERFDVHLLPTTWLIDATGRQVAVAHGMLDWRSEKVEKMLELLVPTSSSLLDPVEESQAPRE